MFIIINKQIVIYYDGFDEMGGNRPRAIRIKVSHASVCTASKFSFSHLAPETNDCFDFKFSAHDFSPTFPFDAVKGGTTKIYRIPDWSMYVLYAVWVKDRGNERVSETKLEVHSAQ